VQFSRIRILSAVNTRRLFVYSGLLVLLITGTAFAGRYQRTKDNKTRVWNENPKPGDLVTWSGARDAKGYASGYGTVTWFTPQNELETGSHIARQRHYTVSRRESGMMVHGKFEEASAAAEAKKTKQRDISEQRPSAPSTRTEATATNPQPRPAQEQATSPTPTPSPAPTNDSLDSLMHVPSSLKLNSPSSASLPSSPSPTAMPDTSPQLSPASSPSPSPQ
jgi:hypothetical protein